MIKNRTMNATAATRIALTMAVASATALGQRVQLPPSTRSTLGNGLTVILMEYKRVPVVHFRLVARGGSAGDTTGLEGLAGIATTLMRDGTTTRSSTEIAEAIDAIGGSLSAAAGMEYCAVSCEVLKKDLDAGLALFSDVILHPSFPTDELDRERKQWLANLASTKESPQQLASLAFRKAVYGAHPYGRQTIGTKASLEAFEEHHLIDFYQKTFVPNNCVLAVVGDMSGKEMLGALQQTFGEWKAGEVRQVALPAPPKLTGRTVLLVDKADATQTQIIVGNIGIDVKSPDAFAVKVANSVLGDGFTSRLMDALRIKQSLTYSVASGFSSHLFGGTYAVFTFTKNESLGEMLDALLAEVGKFREGGAGRDELRKAQNYLAGSFSRDLQAPEALASRLTDIEVYGFPRDYYEQYIEKLRSVSPDDVRRVAQKHFLVDDVLIVLVAPSEQTRKVAEKYGPVTVIDLDEAVQ